MGATSVTGVGHGSAEGANKGNEHVSMGIRNLIGPRVIAAGSIPLVANVAMIQVPVLSALASDYIIVATAVNGTTVNAVTVTAFTIATDSAINPSSNIYAPGAGTVTTTSFDASISFKGAGATDVVNYAIIKSGVA